MVDEVKLPLEPLHFFPLKDFKAEVYGVTNSYLRGLGYTVKPGNEVLLEKVMGWFDNGLVRFGDHEAKVTGMLRVR